MQALELLKELGDQTGVTACEKDIDNVFKENAMLAPVPAIDNHAHPLFRSDLKKNAGLYMAAKHFRLKDEALPVGLDDMLEDMDRANVGKALIMALDTSK